MCLPKISVITVSYNSVLTIEKTIKSVIEQDYIEKEYIIIDGGSKDGTQEIVAKYNEYIDVFVSEKDNGISDAFNKGIVKATGDLIVLINSDDYLLPNALSLVASQYDKTSDLFCGNLLLWNPSTHYKCVIKPSLEFPLMPFFKRSVHQGVFVTKELYKRLGGYDEKLNYAMDLDFLMRATRIKAKFKYMDIDIAVFRLGGATSDSIFKKKKEYIYLIKKNGGNVLQAYMYYSFLVVTQVLKSLLNIKGLDIVRRIRYKKI